MSLIISRTASISIATGASAAVVIVFAVGYMIHRWRKGRRERRQIDEEKTRSSTGVPTALAEPCKPSITGRRSAHSPEVAWTVLTPNDDLPFVPRVSTSTSRSFYTSQRVAKPRSTLLKRRPSFRHSFPLKAIRPSHLSDIPESPKQNAIIAEIRSPHLARTGSTRRRFEWARRSPSMKRTVQSPAEEGGTITLDRMTPPGSPRADISPAPALKPEPLLQRKLSIRKSAFMDPDMACITDRSRSVPSILGTSKDDPFSTRSKSFSHMRQHSRSISLCKQESGSVPQRPPPPPPPPPTAMSTRPQRPQIMLRNGSATSASSVETANSSILQRDLASPSMQARNEFAQRNPEMKLGAHLRQGSGDVADIMAQAPTVGARQPRNSSRKRTKIQKTGPRSVPKKSLLPVFEAQARSKSTGTLHIDRLKDPTNHIQQAMVTKVSPVPSRSGSLEIRLGAVAAPGKRRSLVGVSEHGSPGERHKDSPLRQVSGNLAFILPRDDSQSSVDTSNPFHWDPTYVPEKQLAKPSALKGSPSARGKRNRNSRVRISVQPIEIGPVYHSTSLNRLDELGIDTEGDEFLQSGHTSPSQQDPSRLRVDRTLQGSPKLRLSQAHRDAIVAKRPEFRQSTQSSSFNRQSTASSNLTLSAFPDPSSDTGFVFPFSQRCEPQPCYSEPDEEMDKAFVPRGLNIHSGDRSSPTGRMSPNDQSRKLRNEYGPQHGQSAAGQDHEDDLLPQMHAPLNVGSIEDGRLLSQPAPLRSLSPPPKSSPTIHVSTPTHDAATLRNTPLSSTINPLNTKPDLIPPYSDFKPSLNFPSGPRSAPPQTLLKCVRSLRRMDSDKLDMLENDEATKEEWRYLHIGREASPTLGSSLRNERSSPLLREILGEKSRCSGKENRPGSAGDATDEEDGPTMWSTGGSPEPVATHKSSSVVLTPRSRNEWKRSGHAGDSHSRLYSSGGTPLSLYDEDGFFVERSP